MRLLKPPASAEWGAACALGIMALVLAVATFLMAFHSLSPLPLYDDWEFLDPSQILPGLFALHAEHRIVLSKLVFLADIRLLHGRHVGEFIVDALALLSLGAAYWCAVKLDPRLAPTRAFLAAAIVVCFAVSPVTLGVLLWAMHVQNVAINVCALFAFLCLAKSARGQANGVVHYPLFGAALFLGGFASLVSSPGILIPILMIPEALFLRMRRAATTTIGIVAVASGWYYLHGNPGQGTVLGTLRSAPVLVCKFFLTFLGSFITETLRNSDRVAYPGLTLCFGIVSIVILAMNAFEFVRIYRTDRNGYPIFGLFTLTAGAFFLISAGLVAGGRATFGAQTAYTEHYNMLRALYWANVLISVPACWNTARAWLLVSALALCAAIAFAVLIPPKRIGLVSRDASLNRGGAAIASDVYDVPAWDTVNIWDHSNKWTIPFEQVQVALLRRTGQSFFNQAPPVWLGRQITDLPVVDHSCPGSILTAEPGTDLQGAYVTVKGWVRATINTDKLPQIVLADGHGVVRGFGAVDANRTGKSGWIGYARLSGAPSDAYVFQAGSLCRLVEGIGR
jgi:hypothetical protein